MHARVVVGLGKGVFIREVSSVQGCPYRGVPFLPSFFTYEVICELLFYMQHKVLAAIYTLTLIDTK